MRSARIKPAIGIPANLEIEGRFSDARPDDFRQPPLGRDVGAGDGQHPFDPGDPGFFERIQQARFAPPADGIAKGRCRGIGQRGIAGDDGRRIGLSKTQ